MLFNSIQFIIFFIVVIIVYFNLNPKFRWFFLLISSSFFYMMWNPYYILLLLFSTFINFYLSLKISKTRNKSKRKLYLIVSLFVSLGILFIFKYLTLVNSTFNYFFSALKLNYRFDTLNILLPMGISFYTFQTLSYTIDVYRNDIKPEKGFLKFTLFITFFPQLVAGPIERFDRLMPQLLKSKRFDIIRAIKGIQIMLIGYFKKCVVADRLAIMINSVYNNPYNYSGLSLTIATVLFSFQIYCDFSGYSEIALGCAKVLGIDIMDNFKLPFFSKSIKEFWRRWHISLSNWFKDYVYIPLGGSRNGKAKKYLNLFLTFLLSGLWHGANWTYVLWGMLHGLYQIIGDITFKFRQKFFTILNLNQTYIHKILKVTITFGLVCFSWTLFRANTISDSIYIIKNLFNDISHWSELGYIYDTITNMGLNLLEFIISILSVIILVIYELLSRKTPLYNQLNEKNILIRSLFYIFLILIIFTMGVFNNASQFIYFQF